MKLKSSSKSLLHDIVTLVKLSSNLKEFLSFSDWWTLLIQLKIFNGLSTFNKKGTLLSYSKQDALYKSVVKYVVPIFIVSNINGRYVFMKHNLCFKLEQHISSP
jgi:hypothetical protein